ncbi:MAG: metallophosphoesterase family protein [Nitrospina sp.]|nr:metallophosphoesterase family protein [Nitrospina sp.]MBT6296928.1 metallophosphoesterase family protein [Nitrospina sp.]MBT6662623.1 metallophosphoesterase family protein [Nitrospina sp.]MBT7521310.1 metallophosphoesterase family protein [Nitrospina sp.]MDG1844607.1 metallophosphoesterase family protein [Nitrospinaceae bacterium]
MKFIIFSDIHSNLESLQSFCRVTESVLHDKKVCLGDIVGYNADPNPVVEWVRDKTDFALAGNHDYSVLNKTDPNYLNPAAYQASLWTRRNLTNSNKDFLNTLPIEKEEDGIYWVHSSPFEPKKWHYVSTKKSAEKNFNYFDQAICFVGHSHLPGIFEKNKNNKVYSHDTTKEELDPESRYIINVGSLGQPRDGNPDPVFVFYDSVSHIVKFFRFSYDLFSTQQKIIACGLPYILADRLRKGL